MTVVHTVSRQRDKVKLGGENAGADRTLRAQAEHSLSAQPQPVQCRIFPLHASSSAVQYSTRPADW